MKLAHQIAWNVLAGATGKVAIALLGLLILGIITRSLGPDDFGHYRTVLTFIALAGMFTNFGTHTLALREISRNDAKQEHLIGSAITFRFTATLLALLISAAIVPLFDFEPIVLKGILIGLFGWLAYLTNEVITAVFYNKLKQHLASIAEVTGTALTCIMVYLFASMDMGMLAMLGALVSGQILTACIAGFFANRLIPLRFQIDWSNWSYLIKAGWPIGASIILDSIIMRGDTMLLAIIKPAADVGFYGVGTKIFEILISLPPLFTSLMMPLFVRSAGLPEKFRYYANHSLNIMMLAGVFVCCVLIQFSNEIVLLIAGDQFEQSGPVIRILAPAIIIVYINILFSFALTAVGKQKSVFKADLCGLFVAIPAYLILIPMFSYEGAAWAKVAAYAVVLSVTGSVMIREEKINIRPVTILKLSLIGLSTVYMFTELADLDIHWILNIILGGILFLAASLLTGILPISELHLFGKKPESK